MAGCAARLVLRGVCAVAALLATLAAAAPARADDWQLCISSQPDHVLADCPAGSSSDRVATAIWLRIVGTTGVAVD